MPGNIPGKNIPKDYSRGIDLMLEFHLYVKLWNQRSGKPANSIVEYENSGKYATVFSDEPETNAATEEEG